MLGVLACGLTNRVASTPCQSILFYIIPVISCVMVPPPVLKVGSDFDTCALLKKTCQDFAICNGFELTTEWLNKNLSTMTCKADESWLPVASLCIRSQRYNQGWNRDGLGSPFGLGVIIGVGARKRPNGSWKIRNWVNQPGPDKHCDFWSPVPSRLVNSHRKHRNCYGNGECIVQSA